MSGKKWITGKISTPVGEIPRVSTRMSLLDRLGYLRVRLSIFRTQYSVPPGLYAVGKPTAESPVFVSANYKYSFDHLRRSLEGRDGWIMVLDTRSINVWCAAGKRTFGTDEVISRIRATRLSEVVSHHKLILPQLGAPGVKGHEVKKQTGFTVRFGPVRAADLPAYLDNERKATPRMRLVRFGFIDRLVLVPEYILSYGLLGLVVGGVLITGFNARSLLDRDLSYLADGLIPFFGGTMSGAVLVPALLPWLPGRSFSAKGAWAGLLYLLGLGGVILWRPDLAPGWMDGLAWILLVLCSASFVGMNFTGSSTYTSLSGVRKEITVAIRFQVAALIIGLALWLPGRLA